MLGMLLVTLEYLEAGGQKILQFGIAGVGDQDGLDALLSALNVVIVRAYVSTQTLHPQWSGYGYTWRRDLNSVREQQYARGPVSQEWLSSPFNALIERSRAGEKNPWLRRRLRARPRPTRFSSAR